MDKFYSNSIEDLAKNAFEKEADDAFSGPANWDKMQQLLNQEMPQKRKKKPVVFWFFIFLMAGLLITGASKFFTGNKSINTVKPVANKNDHSEKSLPIIVNKEPNHSKAPTQLMNHSKVLVKQKPKSKSQSQSSVNPLKNKISNKQLQAVIPETINASSLNKIEQENLSNEVVESEQNKQLEEVDSAKQEFINANIDSTTSNSESKNPLSADTIVTQFNNKIAEKKPSKWEWNLTIAPDFLLANIQPLHQPGFTVGVGINYLLSPKLRIRSGLLYNYTPINASGDGYLYKPSPNLPSYTSLELRNVKGDLHVFEVPLSLRYTAQPNKKWSFISSVGLSSLFFIKQQYTYDLLLNGSTPLLWNSANDTDDNGESHVLNNLTIGAGLSVKTKRNLVLEIEPMFKLPLEELGEGHNRLGTIALYFNLRMPINKQKK